MIFVIFLQKIEIQYYRSKLKVKNKMTGLSKGAKFNLVINIIAAFIYGSIFLLIPDLYEQYTDSIYHHPPLLRLWGGTMILFGICGLIALKRDEWDTVKLFWELIILWELMVVILNLASFAYAPYTPTFLATNIFNATIVAILAVINIYFYLISDINQSKMEILDAMHEAELANKLKSSFLANMSHELRTPLNSIIGFSELLMDKSYGSLNEVQEEFLIDIYESSDYLLNLINHLLDIPKIETGKLELRIKRIQLENLINQLIATLKPLYESKKLSFDIEGVNPDIYIYADPVRIKEILYNLLSNAFKFTFNGGVSLKLLEKQSLWEFNIIDTGIGIDEKDFDLIFEEFKRIQSSLVNSTSGTGLGLSVTKRLVTLHGGDIYFTSKIGVGSTFTFTLPKILEKDIKNEIK